VTSTLDDIKAARRAFNVSMTKAQLPSGLYLSNVIDQVRLLNETLCHAGIEKVELEVDGISLHYHDATRQIYIKHNRQHVKIRGDDATVVSVQPLICAPLAVLDQALLLLPRFMQAAAQARSAPPTARVTTWPKRW